MTAAIRCPSLHRGCRTSAGFTLIETMIALMILLVVAAGVLPLGLVAMNATESR